MLLFTKLNLLQFNRPLLIRSTMGLKKSCTRGFKKIITKENNQRSKILYLKPNYFDKVLVCNYSKNEGESPVKNFTEKGSAETEQPSSDSGKEGESMVENFTQKGSAETEQPSSDSGKEGESMVENFTQKGSAETKQPSSDSKEKSKSLENIFQEISQGDPEILRKLKVIEFEVAIYRENYEHSPILKKKDWELLLELPNYSQKKKLLNFLFKNQKKRENYWLKKQRIIGQNLEKYNQLKEETGMDYQLGKNSLFLRLNGKTLKNLYINKLMAAKMFNQNIVFDCSYDSYMSRINSRLCGKQLGLCFNTNRLHQLPFEVKLCNVNFSSPTIQFFNQSFSSSPKEDFSWEMYEESYLDLYPKKQLVYLTPHCRNELHHFDHNAVYIIGAFVDKGIGVKASLVKAKKENLKMAKLPIDRYVQWNLGTKSLPLNIVLQILLDRQIYDWNVAFRNLPKRNVRASYFDEFSDCDEEEPEEDDVKKITEIL